jgi:ribosome-binding factor A
MKNNTQVNNKIAERRHKQGESEILNILNHTLKYEVYDKDIKMVSFTYVKLTNDKSLVKVFVDFYNRDKIDALVKKLNNSKAVFRTALSQNMNVWKVPNILFEKDESIDRVIAIEKLLKK